jgi:hypothetical protein
MTKFRYIGENMVLIAKNGDKSEHPANCYGGNKLMKGDTVELDGWLETKALKNPNYEIVKRKPGPKPKKDIPLVVEEQL